MNLCRAGLGFTKTQFLAQETETGSVLTGALWKKRERREEREKRSYYDYPLWEGDYSTQLLRFGIWENLPSEVWSIL